MKSSDRVSIVVGVIGLVTLTIPVACIWHGGADYLPGVARNDFEYYFCPQYVFLHRWLAQGIFPLWNPHLFCGYPTAEIQQSALFYPPNLLTLSLFPPRAGILAALAGHVVLAALLTFLTLVKCFRCSPAASMVGALVYVFGGVFSHRFIAGHLTIVYALTWIPPAIGCFHKALASLSQSNPCRDRRSATIFWCGLGSMAIALVIVAGSPQYVFYLFWAHAGLVAVTRGSSVARRLLILGATWLPASLMSSPQWLPALFYLPYASREAGLYANILSLKVRAVTALEYLLPSPLGDGLREAHLQMRGVWETAGYCGVVAIVLALTGAVFARRVSSLLRSTATVGLALLLLGFYLMFGGWLPGFSGFREPLKAMCLVNLATALLAAAGMDTLFTKVAQDACGKARRTAIALSGTYILFALVAAAVVAIAPSVTARVMIGLSEFNPAAHGSVTQAINNAQNDPWAIAWPAFRALVTTAVIVTLATLLLLGIRRFPASAMVALALVAVADPLAAHWRLFVSRVPLAGSGWQPGFENRIRELLTEGQNSGRPPWRMNVPQPMSNAAQLIDGLREPGGYDPLMPRHALARTGFSLRREDIAQVPVLRTAATGVRYRILDETSQLPEETAQQERRFTIREVNADASVADLLPGVLVHSGDEEFGPLHGRQDFVSEKDRDAIPESIRVEPDGTSQTNAVTGHVRYRGGNSPSTMVFDISTTMPAYLLVRTTWAPGWRAQLNGKNNMRPIQTNGWMMGLPVDSSVQQVKLTYVPVLLQQSVAIALLTLALVAAVIISSALPSRRRATVAPG